MNMSVIRRAVLAIALFIPSSSLLVTSADAAQYTTIATVVTHEKHNGGIILTPMGPFGTQFVPARYEVCVKIQGLSVQPCQNVSEQLFDELAVGSRVTVTYQTYGNGRVYLAEVKKV